MILVENKIVIAVMDNYEQKENGKLINGKIYPMGDVIDIVAEDYIIPIKYCYTVEKGFYINEVWKNETNQTIDSFISELVMKGAL